MWHWGPTSAPPPGHCERQPTQSPDGRPPSCLARRFGGPRRSIARPARRRSSTLRLACSQRPAPRQSRCSTHCWHSRPGLGRTRSGLANAPRAIDLDLIAFGTETRTTPTLVLPHPRAHERAFVLAPLAEIAPGLVLPGQQQTGFRVIGNARPIGGDENGSAFYLTVYFAAGVAPAFNFF